MPAKVGSYITHVQRRGDHNKPNVIVQSHPIYSSMQTLDSSVVWRYCTSTSYSKPSLMQALSGCLILDIPQGWCVIAGRFEPLEKCFVTDAITVISHKPMPVNANEIAEMLGKPLDIRNLSQGLSGRERGTLVCSCFRVSDSQIQQAIEQHNIQSLHQLHTVLKCGTNCGSCIPELSNALEQNVIFMK